VQHLSFDLRGVDTYHTRPMSQAWSKLHDVDLLADGRAAFDFDIPLAEFPRLRLQLGAADGRARGTVRFGREVGNAVADLEFAADVPLVCQRCMGPFRRQVEAHGRVALLADERAADKVPEERETMFVEGNRVRLLDVVEEELLLSLPIVPLHESEDECSPGEQESFEPAAHEPAEDTVQRPFERLGELLKRDQ
jgi:uncharacterized protein